MFVEYYNATPCAKKWDTMKWSLPCWSPEFSDVSEREFMCPTHSEAKWYQNTRVRSRERLIAELCKEMDDLRPRPTQTPGNGLSKAFLKAKWGKGEVDCGKLLDAETLCPHWSGYSATVNLQLNKCSSLFTFCSLCEWKSTILFKVKDLRIGYPVYFKL